MMTDSSAEANRQRRHRQRYPKIPSDHRTNSKRPEYLRADSWSILFRAVPNPTANRLIIEQWRVGLPSI